MLGLNPEQWRVVYQSLFTAGSPLAILLVQQFGLAPEKVNAWMNMAAIILPIIGTVWMANSRTSKNQVAAITQMPAGDKAAALATIPDAAKVEAAASVPGATVMVDPSAASQPVMDVARDIGQPSVVIDTGGQPR